MADRMRASAAAGSKVNENDFSQGLDHPEADKTFPLSQPGGNLDMSLGNSDKQASTSEPHCRKKHKVDGPDSALMEFLANLHHDTNNHLEVISSRIGYEFDLGQANQDVFDKLGTVDGLTLTQEYRLCNILGDKPQRAEVFMGMLAATRLGYLLMCIKESDKGA